MYDNILNEIDEEKIEVITMPMASSIKGLYADDVIALNENIITSSEKTCILAEELGHYHTSMGDILDQTKLSNRKQELRARRWAVKRLLQITDFISAFNDGIRNRHELAEYLGVTEEFINTSVEHFRSIYGYSYTVDNYLILLDPLVVIKRV